MAALSQGTVAFVAAMECEAGCVTARLANAVETREFGRRVVRGLLGRRSAMVVVSGIGKANAAAAAQFAVQSGASELASVGVCGGFEPGMKPGDVYEVDRAVQYDFDLSAVDDKGPGFIDGRDTPYFALAACGLFPAKTLGTGDRFTESDADFPLLRRLGVGLRDMEGAAVAQVAETAGIPCRAIKCVTNTIGETAGAQYSGNLVRSLEALSKAVAEAWNI
ncbi:MAG: 5'-methylthioadenosine/S-adenosylhomocysteine nucleosidase [Kiritimatiellae bacterium]|nr:5'-methylthioadenosine/S-adenosylhomocysteine nucleosidase [Kiritimatiellia bacterium]